MNKTIGLRLLLAVSLLIISKPEAAVAERLVPVHDSVSPNGRYSLVLIPDPGEEPTGVLRIQNTSTHKLAGHFGWASFGTGVNEYSIRAVLWSPDSRCFALYWGITRGNMECAIYVHYNGRWTQLKMPDYESRIFKRSKVIEELRGHGGSKPTKWLSNNTLRIEFVDRGIPEPDRTGDTMQLFWVTIRVKLAGKHQRPAAILKHSALAPRSAYWY